MSFALDSPQTVLGRSNAVPPGVVVATSCALPAGDSARAAATSKTFPVTSPLADWAAPPPLRSPISTCVKNHITTIFTRVPDGGAHGAGHGDRSRAVQPRHDLGPSVTQLYPLYLHIPPYPMIHPLPFHPLGPLSFFFAIFFLFIVYSAVTSPLAMATKGKKINKDEEKEPLQVFAHPASARARAAAAAAARASAVAHLSFHFMFYRVGRDGTLPLAATVATRCPVPSGSLRASLPPSAAHFHARRQACRNTGAARHARTHARSSARTLATKP